MPIVRRMGDVVPRVIYKAAGASLVKSAQRTMEILEFFADYKAVATRVEIAEALGYPESSTGALLKTLVDLGYLRYDVQRRSYSGAPRLAFLGDWIDPDLVTPGPIHEMMQRINDRSGERVILVSRDGTHIRYIHSVYPKHKSKFEFGMGHALPLTSSGGGRCFLSVLPDAEVVALARRINTEVDPTRVVKVNLLLDAISEIRRIGYALYYGVDLPYGVVAVYLSRPPPLEPFAVCISASIELLKTRHEEFASILKEEVGSFYPR